MPQLPQYTSEKALQGLQINNAGAEGWEMAGRRIGESYHQLGQLASNAISEIGDHAAMQDTINTTNNFTAAIPALQDAAQEVLKSGGGADEYMEAATSIVDSVGKGIVSYKGQNFYQLKRGEVLTEGLKSFLAHKSVLDGQSLGRAVRGARESAAKIAGDDWRQTQSQMKQLGTTLKGIVQNSNAPKISGDDWKQTGIQIEQLGNSMSDAAANSDNVDKLTPESVQRLIDENMTPVANAGLENLVQEVEYGTMKPGEALEIVKDTTNPLYAASENKRSEAEGRIMKAQSTFAAIQSDVLKTQVPDWIKLARQGDSTAISNLTNLRQNYQGATPKETAVARAEIGRDTDDAAQFYAASKDVAGMPKPQLQAALDTLPVESARTPAQAAFAEAAKQREADYHASPPTYTIMNDPVVKTRFATYSQNPSPENFQAYAQASIASQSHAEPNEVPRILPPAFVNDVAQKFHAIPNTPDGWQQAATTLQQLQATTGSYWNYAVHELQAQHVLKPGQYVAGMLIGRPESWALAGDVLKATSTSGEDLYKQSGIPEAKAYSVARGALKDFSNTFSDTANGHELTESYITALADTLRYKADVTPATAARFASAMILDRYNLRGGLRIPKQFDDLDVATGADNVLADIKNHDLVPPASGSGFGPALQADTYKADVQDYGHFSTNAKGDGVQLFDQYGSPVYEKRNGATVPVELKYSDLDAMGKRQRGILQNVGRFITQPSTLLGAP